MLKVLSESTVSGYEDLERTKQMHEVLFSMVQCLLGSVQILPVSAKFSLGFILCQDMENIKRTQLTHGAVLQVLQVLPVSNRFSPGSPSAPAGFMDTCGDLAVV